MWKSLKYVWPLFLCQSFCFSSVTQFVFSASIIGKDLGGEQLATLPVALMPVGTAIGIIPATKLMSFYGRRVIFITALLFLIFSNLLIAYSITESNFIFLCLGSFFIGTSLSAISQLRFVAMEIAPSNLQTGAASIVLLGGIFAAIIGPEIGLGARSITSTPFVGSYIAMAALALCALPFLLTTPSKVNQEGNHQQGRSIKELLHQPQFLIAVSASTVAYAIMSFIMTATPISMHEHFNHSLSDTKQVIQSHIMAMFIPSLFTAWLVKRLSIHTMMLMGLVAFAISLLVAFIDQQLLGFWASLVLLGIGWNFLFVGGTVLLPKTHTKSERFRAQGFNDSIVFSIQATVCLSSGIALSFLGWKWMLLTCAPLIVWHLYLLLKTNKSLLT